MGELAENSDRELLEKFKDENTRNYAFNLIVNKYQRKLYAIIRRIVIDHDDTDDVLQNTFIKAWANLDKFRESL